MTTTHETPRSRVIGVRGMTCGACATTVERALARVPGVDRAEVSFAARAATVDGDVDEAALLEAIAASGYEGVPSAADEGTPSIAALIPDDASHDARRRAFAAVGLCAFTLLAARLDPGLAALGAGATLLGPGRGLFVQAVRLLRAGHAAMDTLVALGAGAAFGFAAWRLAAGEPAPFATASFIVTFVLVGRALEESARNRATAALRRLGARATQKARRLEGGREVEVDPAELRVGDVFVVRDGESVATDGVVVEGASSFDESLLTGESLPQFRDATRTVVGGSVNVGGQPVHVRATAAGAESTLARIIAWVARAQASKPPVQALADRVAAVFVPIVLVIAAGVWLVRGDGLAAVAVLVVACPCALGLATPTVVQAASGRAALLGVLVREPGALERAAAIDVLVLDKTGTLTMGEPLVEGLAAADAQGEEFGAARDGPRGDDGPTEGPAPDARARAADDVRTSAAAQPAAPAPGRGRESDPAIVEPLAAAAAVESASGHPLARAIRTEVERRSLTLPRVELLSIESGHGGVEGRLADARRVTVGSARWLTERGVDVAPIADALEVFERRGWTVAGVAIDGRARLALGIADRPRPTSSRAVRILDKLGIRAVMSTGDHAAAARSIGALVGIDDVHGGESPYDKADRVRALQAEGRVVGMVGDGTNDAPALAVADVGFAVGGATDVARVSAPIVLVRGDLARCTTAIELARAARAIIRENLVLAFAYNVVALPAAALGQIDPPYAAAAMAASSLAVVGNALRLHRFRSRLETDFGEES